jgi:hypothetical protein
LSLLNHTAARPEAGSLVAVCTISSSIGVLVLPEGVSVVTASDAVVTIDCPAERIWLS